eukprot:1105734-Rhodomonas_salina.2
MPAADVLELTLVFYFFGGFQPTPAERLALRQHMATLVGVELDRMRWVDPHSVRPESTTECCVRSVPEMRELPSRRPGVQVGNGWN